MRMIPKETRANLKRLCPYSGPYIPRSVRENAREFYTARSLDEFAGWVWDDGTRRWELELSDLDGDYIDPAGYVAVRPLGSGECALEICAEGVEGFPSLIFNTVQDAKRYIDTLLAADTPEIPFEG
jgi:hypothetical protein